MVFNKIDTNIIETSIPVTANSKILQFVVDLQIKAYEDDKDSILSNKVEKFKNLFGKPNMLMHNEYSINVYVLEFRNTRFNVFTGEGYGSSYELVDADFEQLRKGNYNELIKDFLEEIDNL